MFVRTLQWNILEYDGIHSTSQVLKHHVMIRRGLRNLCSGVGKSRDMEESTLYSNPPLTVTAPAGEIFAAG